MTAAENMSNHSRILIGSVFKILCKMRAVSTTIPRIVVARAMFFLILTEIISFCCGLNYIMR